MLFGGGEKCIEQTEFNAINCECKLLDHSRQLVSFRRGRPNAVKMDSNFKQHTQIAQVGQGIKSRNLEFGITAYQRIQRKRSRL